MPIFSFISVLYVIIRFKLSHELSSNRIVKGDSVIYTCGIYNEDILAYPEINVVFEGEHLIFQDQINSQSFILMPKSHYDLSITLSCKYWGLYNIGIKYIEIVDFFNLFKLRYSNFIHKKILVYPKILYLKNVYINRIGNVERGINDNIKSFSNQSLTEIKNYEYGERMSLVHWKISTRLGKLMSKKMESITDERYSIFLDLFKSDLNQEENIILEDKLIELFVSFINVISRSSIPFDFHYMLVDGYRKEQYSNPAQFDYFYEHVSNVQFSKSQDIVTLLTNFHVELSDISLSQGKLFIFTFNLTMELIELLSTKVMQGYSVFIFFVSPEELLIKENEDQTEPSELINITIQSGIRIYEINISDDITNILNGEIL